MMSLSNEDLARLEVSAIGQRCIIYVRISSETGGTGLETQERICRTTAEQRGYAVLRVVEDVHTGVEWQRPGISALLEAATRGEFDVLLVDMVDRLGRDAAYHMLEGAFAQAGVTIDFAEQHFGDDAAGKFHKENAVAASGFERANILRRMPGARPPYGYLFAGSKKWTLTPDERGTAEVVRRMDGWAADGVSIGAIAVRLTVEGVPTPTGKAVWNGSVIRGMLRNPIYRGENLAHRWRSVKVEVPRPGAKKHRYPVLRSESEVRRLSSPVPALVDTATWDAAQTGYRPRGGVRDPEASTLRGRVFCGQCGHGMSLTWVTGGGTVGYRCLHCPRIHSVVHRLVDKRAWEATMAIMSRPERLRAQVERLATQDPATLALTAVGRKLAELKQQTGNIARAIAAIGLRVLVWPASQRKTKGHGSRIEVQTLEFAETVRSREMRNMTERVLDWTTR